MKLAIAILFSSTLIASAQFPIGLRTTNSSALNFTNRGVTTFDGVLQGVNRPVTNNDTAELIFPGGIHISGSQSNMAFAGDMRFHLNGSPSGWGQSGDQDLYVINWSTNANNSGGGFGIAVMAIHTNTGQAVIYGLPDMEWKHVPTNRITSLQPGNGMLVFNRSTNFHGFSICSPNVGLDSGNYSFLYIDADSEVTGVPLWQSGVYRPQQTGTNAWVWAFKVDPNTGTATFNREVIVTNAVTMRVGPGADTGGGRSPFLSDGSLNISDVIGSGAVGRLAQLQQLTTTNFTALQSSVTFTDGTNVSGDVSFGNATALQIWKHVGGWAIGIAGTWDLKGNFGSFVESSRDFVPALDSTRSLGAPARRWSYVNTVTATNNLTRSPTNVAPFTILAGNTDGIFTNDFVMNQYYTNKNQRAFVFATIGIETSATMGEVSLYLDQNADGTFEQTGILMRGGPVGVTNQLAGAVQPNARFMYTNTSATGVAAGITTGSSQWVLQ